MPGLTGKPLNMNSGVIFLGLALVALAVGLIGHSYPAVDGLGKALFGVFLILYFIRRFFGEEKA